MEGRRRRVLHLLRFRLRTLFLVVSVLCVLLGVWRYCSVVVFQVEPTRTRDARVSGRFFSPLGSSGAFVQFDVLYSSPWLRPRFYCRSSAFAKRGSWGRYHFDGSIGSFSQPGRYDVRLQVYPDLMADFPSRTQWVSYGDLSLPPCCDESLLPQIDAIEEPLVIIPP